MKTTMADNGQVVIPAKVRKALDLRPGAVLAVSLDGKTIVLEQMITPDREPVKTRWTRSKLHGHLVADTGVPITSEQVKAFLADNFP